MNLKEYLLTNPEPVLNDERNIFILLWLERKGYTTTIGISKTTNIPTKDINAILQVLYKNGLVSIWEDVYRITRQGIGLLDTLGYSDMQIQELLSKTEFSDTEYDLYNDLFSTYRKYYLDIYLLIVQAVEKEQKDLAQGYQLVVSDQAKIEKKEYLTFWFVNIFHDLAHILYTKEESNLISYYNKIYNFCENTYCFSSERYHDGHTDFWKRSKIRDEINLSISKKFRNIIAKYTSRLYGENASKLNSYFLLDINEDLKLSNYIFNQNSTLLNILFSANDVQELAQKLNLSEAQTRVILKSLQSKINELICNDFKLGMS